MRIYHIGGSPCSGKSTVAEALSSRYGLYYFKVDDYLDKYLQQGAADGKYCCAKLADMTAEQIWMRDPAEQCREELQIYQEIFEYILDDIGRIDSRNGIITEGAAWLPTLVHCCHIPSDRYIAITPTKAFQVAHYSRREWVPHVLAGCSDVEKAFENWMERDALFAQTVRKQCDDLGCLSLINDGECPIEAMIDAVISHFGLA